MNDKQIQMCRDAVARWQGYQDRGIPPKRGWGSGGGGGGSCALGDIAFYSGIDTSWGAQLRAMRTLHETRERHLHAAFMGRAPEACVMAALGDRSPRSEIGNLVHVNDGIFDSPRWPIAEMQAIIARAPGEPNRAARRGDIKMLAPMGGLIEFIKATKPASFDEPVVPMGSYHYPLPKWSAVMAAQIAT